MSAAELVVTDLTKYYREVNMEVHTVELTNAALWKCWVFAPFFPWWDLFSASSVGDDILFGPNTCSSSSKRNLKWGHRKSSKNTSASESGRCCCHCCCNCGGGGGSLAVWFLIGCSGNKERCRCRRRRRIAAEHAHQCVAWTLPTVVKNECSELTIRPKHQPRGQEGVVKVADNVLYVGYNGAEIGQRCWVDDVPRRELIEDDVLDELQIR